MDKKLDDRNENVWNEECENLLAEWSEKASCYRWLHGRSEKKYRKWYYCFSIPVIILSTLTGAANVGMDSFVPDEGKSMASAIVGGVNIFAGIISTLQNFLKVAELMEGHRIAGVSWGKLQRNIAIELALDPSRRVLQCDFLKLARAEYDRLIEAGPLINDSIIASFNKKFKNYEVSIPSICNGLDKCNIYKKDKNIPMEIDEFLDGIEDVVSAEEKNIAKSKPIQDIKIVKVNDKKDDDDDSDIKITVKEEDILVNKDNDLEDIGKGENIDSKEEDDMDSVRESEECSCNKNEIHHEVDPEVNDDEELLPEQNKEITDFLDGINSETK